LEEEEMGVLQNQQDVDIDRPHWALEYGEGQMHVLTKHMSNVASGGSSNDH
jgi:hypothetical protein